MKLIEIDLSKAERHEHPDIRTDGTKYLCLIDGIYHAGEFNRVWYGLTFDGWRFNPAAGLQFDEPGTNSSMWERVWEIVEDGK